MASLQAQLPVDQPGIGSGVMLEALVGDQQSQKMLQEGSFPSFNVLDDDTAAAAVATERDGHLHPAHAAIVRKEHRREKRPDGTVIETRTRRKSKSTEQKRQHLLEALFRQRPGPKRWGLMSVA